MKVIFNNIVPPPGFKALCIWPFVFVRRKSNSSFSITKERHESIHAEQEKEMLLIFFFIWYIVEFLIKLCYYRDRMIAYYAISFEREAYCNQGDEEYLSKRKHYSWIKYIRK